MISEEIEEKKCKLFPEKEADFICPKCGSTYSEYGLEDIVKSWDGVIAFLETYPPDKPIRKYYPHGPLKFLKEIIGEIEEEQKRYRKKRCPNCMKNIELQRIEEVEKAGE